MPHDATVLTPLFAAREPELISDGGGLPFPPSALFEQFTALDPNAAPVQALLAQINQGLKQSQGRRILRRRSATPRPSTEEKLAGWRALASTDDEILYAKGRPPQLLTVAVTRRGNRWAVLGVSNSRPLRAVRQGSRASSWRLDPDFPTSPQSTDIHILVTEQSRATGMLADDRMLAPDIHLDAQQVMLRLYVQPIQGYTGPTKRHETAVIVRLPEPLGEREIVDGALYDVPS